MKDLSETRINNVFQVPKGLWCFAVAEGIHLMATGGPDCLVFILFTVKTPSSINQFVNRFACGIRFYQTNLP